MLTNAKKNVAQNQDTDLVQYVKNELLMSSLFELVKRSGGYKVTNDTLLVPSPWMYTMNTREAFNNSREVIWSGRAYTEKPSICNYIQRVGSDIYTFPLFNKQFLDIIRKEIRNIQNLNMFEPNSEDPEDVRIEEFILNRMCPEWYMALLHNIIYDMNMVFYYLFGQQVGSGDIQIANYKDDKIKQTGWHHDVDADISMVVPLNTGEYRGGGTEFFNRGVVDPLPNGTGLIFPSMTHAHRGLPVESGERLLLVFWLKIVPK